MRSYTVTYWLNGYRERSLFGSLRDAERYAEQIRGWRGVTAVTVG